MTKERVGLAAVVLGFSGLVAEILLLRELLIVFSGNELSIGVILANWLILEAVGSISLGRSVARSKHGLEAFVAISVLFSILLFVAVLLTRGLKVAIGVSVGESIGLWPAFYASLLIQLPVSMLHGALFTLSCRLFADFSGQDASSAGRVYVYETVGTLVGGVVCTYLLIPHLTTLLAFAGLGILNLVMSIVLLLPCWETGLIQKALLIGLGGLTIMAVALVSAGKIHDLHDRSIRAQWRHQSVVHYQNSQYGNICVVENEGQYVFFLDGRPAIITPIPDIPFVEEFVHLPLLAHPNPARILILSGGAGGVISEALKHPTVELVKYAELDPLLLTLLRTYPTQLTESELSDERVRVKLLDGRLLLKTMTDRFDLVFIGIHELSSLQANRFYTREFFTLAAERLEDGGILVLAIPGSLTLLNEELRDLNSCIYHTLTSVFSHVRPMPGDGLNVYLSSNSPEILTLDTEQAMDRLTERGIMTTVMVPWHVEQKLHQGWQAWFAQFIQEGSRRANADFRPLGLFHSISHWNALHAPAFGRLYRQVGHMSLVKVVLLVVGLLLLFLCVRSRSARLKSAGIPLAIAATGFSGMVCSLIVIFAFQTIYGYIFSWIGLIVAAFMTGAACGALVVTAVMGRIQSNRALFLKIELATVGFSLALPLVLFATNELIGNQTAVGLFRALFLVLAFIGGLLTGSQFPVANRLCLSDDISLVSTAGLLYASDLLGGWLGGIVGAVVLLPVLGLIGTSVAVGLLKLASFVAVATQPR